MCKLKLLTIFITSSQYSDNPTPFILFNIVYSLNYFVYEFPNINHIFKSLVIYNGHFPYSDTNKVQ